MLVGGRECGVLLAYCRTNTQLLTSLGVGGVGLHTTGSFRREQIRYLVQVYVMRYTSHMESIYIMMPLLEKHTFYLLRSWGGWAEARQKLRQCERE